MTTGVPSGPITRSLAICRVSSFCPSTAMMTSPGTRRASMSAALMTGREGGSATFQKSEEQGHIFVGTALCACVYLCWARCLESCYAYLLCGHVIVRRHHQTIQQQVGQELIECRLPYLHHATSHPPTPHQKNVPTNRRGKAYLSFWILSTTILPPLLLSLRPTPHLPDPPPEDMAEPDDSGRFCSRIKPK